MSPVRPVHMVKDTSAKGQNFKEKEYRERYLVGITLISIKTIAKHDLLDRTNNFYFKANSGKAVKTRIPDKGTINLLPLTINKSSDAPPTKFPL